MGKIKYFSKKYIISNGYDELDSLRQRRLSPDNDVSDLIVIRRRAYYIKDKYGWNEDFKETCFVFIHGLNRQMRQMTLATREGS